MSKIGLIAFAAALILTGVSYAADKIALTCSGTVMVPPLPGSSPTTTDRSFVVDFDNGTVMSTDGQSSITEVTENQVRFQGSDDKHNKHWDGVIDRYAETVLCRNGASDWPYGQAYARI